MPYKPEPIMPGVHNFLTKVRKLVAEGKITPGFNVVDVGHDEWCESFCEGGICNCDPEIRVSTMSNNN